MSSASPGLLAVAAATSPNWVHDPFTWRMVCQRLGGTVVTPTTCNSPFMDAQAIRRKLPRSPVWPSTSPNWLHVPVARLIVCQIWPSAAAPTTWRSHPMPAHATSSNLPRSPAGPRSVPCPRSADRRRAEGDEAGQRLPETADCVSPPVRVLQHVRSARCSPRRPAWRVARVAFRAGPGSSAYGGAALLRDRERFQGTVDLAHRLLDAPDRERTASQSAHAEYVPSSSFVQEPPLVSKVQAQVLKTARARKCPRGFESHTLR
jgi:hypothetical protein